MHRNGFLSVMASIALATALVGCGPGASPSPSPTGSPAPPSASVDFSMTVVPAQSVGRSIPGAHVVYLVAVSGSPTDEPVRIRAQAPNAKTTVEPELLAPGVVGEVTVVPIDCTCDQTMVGVTITAERGAVSRVETREFELVSGTDDWADEAATHLAPFITWLAANRPELGITEQTTWTGTPGAWVLIVEHYLYFSDDWELDLEWHVMVPPDDWSRISLRKRWSETAPSLAFEISSVAGATAPHEIDPPDAVWR